MKIPTWIAIFLKARYHFVCNFSQCLALRARWDREALDGNLRENFVPSNISSSQSIFLIVDFSNFFCFRANFPSTSNTRRAGTPSTASAWSAPASWCWTPWATSGSKWWRRRATPASTCGRWSATSTWTLSTRQLNDPTISELLLLHLVNVRAARSSN